MTVHDHHPSLPGYHPSQILHDGCGECEERGADIAQALYHMDGRTFEKAWTRAADFNRTGGNEEEIGPTLSRAELPLLDVLWATILQFEHRGIPNTVIPGISYAEQELALEEAIDRTQND